MPSKMPFVRRLLVPMLALACVLGALGSAEAGWFKRKAKEPEVPPPGNIAVDALEVFEVRAPGAMPRFLLRARVGNPGAVERAEPFRVIFRSSRGEGLGVCEGEGIKRGELLLCELWTQVDSPHEVEDFVAQLDREFHAMNAFDGNREDDEARTPLDQIAGAPRIERFDVLPRVLQGMGEVRYHYSIERGHLVWLVGENGEPRLIAGHPSNGLLSGDGRLRVRTTGPITIVARDVEGAFVYATIPVTNLHSEKTNAWAHEPPPPSEEESAVAEPRDTSLERVDARPWTEDSSAGDLVVLESLVEYLETRSWAWASPPLRPELIHRARPKPANALNPKR